MPIIRCTGKLTKAIGITKPEAIEGSLNDSIMGDWHAKLTQIEGKKCVILINDKTLLSFIIPDVTKKNLNDIQPLFCHYLESALKSCKVPEQGIEKIINEITTISYAKTNSPRILGLLNEIARNYEYIILQNNGLRNACIPEIVLAQNRTPWGIKEMVIPREEINKLVINESH